MKVYYADERVFRKSVIGKNVEKEKEERERERGEYACVVLNVMEGIKARNYVYSCTYVQRVLKYCGGTRVQHVAMQFYYVYYTLLTVNWTRYYARTN